MSVWVYYSNTPATGYKQLDIFGGSAFSGNDYNIYIDWGNLQTYVRDNSGTTTLLASALSTGWHKWTFSAASEGVTIRIDDGTVFTQPVGFAFQTINLQQCCLAGTAFFDDFEFTLNGNSVDVSAFSGTNIPWSTILQAGYPYAVVDTFMAVNPNVTASQQLTDAKGAGLKTAAFMELNLTPPGLRTNSGKKQAEFGVNLISPFPLKDIEFMAIAVEYIPRCEKNPTASNCYPQDLNSIAARNTAIQQAINVTRAAPIKRIVIYTRNDEWQVITGNATNFALSGIRLWDVYARTATSSYNVSPNLQQNCLQNVTQGSTHCSPFTAYGGWNSRVGEQYVADDETTFGVDVDLNLFSNSLFP